MSTKITARDISLAARTIAKRYPIKTHRLYGVPRGGIPAAYALAAAMEHGYVTDDPTEADIIVDDLVDSGATRDRYARQYPGIPFEALFNKPDEWLVFPWDESAEHAATDIPVRLMQYIGEDVERGGLKETPQRYLKAWKYLTSGYGIDPADVLKVFVDGADNCDEMVLIKNIPFYSQCEHHLIPFFGVAHIAYIPNGSIVGLSKISRVLDIFARRLQVQERLTNQVADALNEHLKPLGVGVVIEARHLCMEARGICQQGHHTVTSALRGVVKENPDTRAEFMSLIR